MHNTPACVKFTDETAQLFKGYWGRMDFFIKIVTNFKTLLREKPTLQLSKDLFLLCRNGFRLAYIPANTCGSSFTEFIIKQNGSISFIKKVTAISRHHKSPNCKHKFPLVFFSLSGTEKGDQWILFLFYIR